MLVAREEAPADRREEVCPWVRMCVCVSAVSLHPQASASDANTNAGDGQEGTIASGGWNNPTLDLDNPVGGDSEIPGFTAIPSTIGSSFSGGSFTSQYGGTQGFTSQSGAAMGAQ